MQTLLPPKYESHGQKLSTEFKALSKTEIKTEWDYTNNFAVVKFI